MEFHKRLSPNYNNTSLIVIIIWVNGKRMSNYNNMLLCSRTQLRL